MKRKTENKPGNKYQYGFIFVLVTVLIKLVCYINLVEWFKKGFIMLFSSRNTDETVKKTTINIGIDAFIVLKLLFVTTAILFLNGKWITFSVVYLLIMNLFTYFYYHIWNPSQVNKDRIRRRFITFCCALIFNILCFNYLFYKGFSAQIEWSGIVNSGFREIFLYSLANTFMLSAQISVANQFGYYLQIAQQLASFVFLVIILSQSIPTNIED